MSIGCKEVSLKDCERNKMNLSHESLDPKTIRYNCM